MLSLENLPNEIVRRCIAENPVGFSRLNNRMLRLVRSLTYWDLNKFPELLKIVSGKVTTLVLPDYMELEQAKHLSACNLIINRGNIGYALFVSHEHIHLCIQYIDKTTALILSKIDSKISVTSLGINTTNIHHHHHSMVNLRARFKDIYSFQPGPNEDLYIIPARYKGPFIFHEGVRLYRDSEDVTDSFVNTWVSHQGSYEAIKNQVLIIWLSGRCSVINPLDISRRFAKDIWITDLGVITEYLGAETVNTLCIGLLDNISLPTVKVINLLPGYHGYEKNKVTRMFPQATINFTLEINWIILVAQRRW